jgi:hypothetical protein
MFLGASAGVKGWTTPRPERPAADRKRLPNAAGPLTLKMERSSLFEAFGYSCAQGGVT